MKRMRRGSTDTSCASAAALAVAVCAPGLWVGSLADGVAPLAPACGWAPVSSARMASSAASGLSLARLALVGGGGGGAGGVVAAAVVAAPALAVPSVVVAVSDAASAAAVELPAADSSAARSC